MTHSKEDNWTQALKALRVIAEMWDLGPDAEDAASEALVAMAEAARQGARGGDLVGPARNAFRQYARMGYMEEPEREVDVFGTSVWDGVMLGLEHYAEGRIMLEEAAIQKMFQLLEDGWEAQARQLWRLIEEWRNWVPKDEPVPIFEPRPDDTSFLDRVAEAAQDVGYHGLWIDKLVSASRNGAGYQRVEWENDLLHRMMEADHVEHDGYTPVYLLDDVDDDRIGMAIRRITRKAIEETVTAIDVWYLKRKVRAITGALVLTDEERAGVARWIAKVILDGREGADPEKVREWAGDLLDVGFSDEADEILFGEAMDTEGPPLPGMTLQEAADSLVDVIAVKPGDEHWKPIHDEDWLKAGGAFQTRRSLPECAAAARIVWAGVRGQKWTEHWAIRRANGVR